MAGARFSDRQLALIGLILVGAAPTASVLSSLGSGEGLFGQIFWAGSKLWMLGLPLLWRLKVDKLPFSWSKPVNGGFGAATLLGLGMSFFMLLGWWLFGGGVIDEALIRAAIAPFDLLSPEMYFGAAMFWIFVNSVIEEYVFRCFDTMYAAFERDRPRLAPEQLHEVRYEDLVADPVAHMEAAYEQLGLGDFERVRPAFETQATAMQKYQRNSYQHDPHIVAAISQRWKPFLDRYGYERPHTRS